MSELDAERDKLGRMREEEATSAEQILEIDATLTTMTESGLPGVGQLAAVLLEDLSDEKDAAAAEREAADDEGDEDAVAAIDERGAPLPAGRQPEWPIDYRDRQTGLRQRRFANVTAAPLTSDARCEHVAIGRHAIASNRASTEAQRGTRT